MGYVFNMGVYYSDINGESEKEKYIIYIKGTYTYVDNKDGSFKVILSNTANLEYGVRYLDGSSIIAPKETAELYALFPTEYTLSDGGIRSTPNGTGITIN